MFRTAYPCVLLICGLVVASASHDDDGAQHAEPEYNVPVDEWTPERVEAIIKAKAAAAENGKSHEEVHAEVTYLNSLYVKHANEGNCGAIINMYDPDVMLIDYSGKVSKGVDAIQLILDKLSKPGSMNVTSLSVSPLGKHARLVFQHERTDIYNHEGNFVQSVEFFQIWKRHPTGLRIRMSLYDLESVTMEK